MTRVKLDRAVDRELLARVLAAQEEERARVARDLHDELGQTLTALGLALSRAEREARAGAAGGRLADDLGQLREHVLRAIDEVRRIAFNLRPTALDDIGLEAALRRHVERWSAETGIPVSFHCNGLREKLDPEVRTTVYRVVQEALNNVARHAGAASVSILVRRHHGQLRAVIEDDGVGFTPGTRENPMVGRGLGVQGMAERLELLGGRLQLESTPGHGTTVAMELSL